MADRYLITVILLVGFAVSISVSTPYLLSQNQQYISLQVQNISDKQLTQINNTLVKLFDRFEERIKQTDRANAEAKHRDAIANNQTVYFFRALFNQSHDIQENILNQSKIILSNLLHHRIVANVTRDEIEQGVGKIIGILSRIHEDVNLIANRTGINLTR